MARVFFSYSHKDEVLRNQLETHLALLKHQGLIDAWHDRRLLAGADLDKSISAEMEASNIILLLVSADFLSSDYCYCREMARAMERHDAGQARVIPVILRHCDWHSAPFGKLHAVPKDGKPILSWPDHDEAFTDVARQIRLAVEELNRANPPARSLPREVRPEPAVASGPAALPRSSNLRLRKEFSDQDRDEFVREAFNYMARYFEGSMQEFESRNPGYKGRFEQVDGRRFSAVIYKNGTIAARCSITLGGFGMSHADQTITFSHDQIGGSINGWLSVKADDQSLFFKSNMGSYSGAEQTHLSVEGAAEHYWSFLIGRLQ